MLYHKALGIICDKYGKKYTKDLQNECYGGTDHEITVKVIEELSLPLTPKKLESQLDDLVRKFLPSAPFQKGAEKLLKHLSAHKVPMALATNSNTETLNLHARSRPKIFNLFQHMVSATDPDVDRGKPQPDIYLATAARFPEKPKPKNCLVFEDSPIGVEAGLAAGMQVVMIPGPGVDRENTRKATVVIRSLLYFRPELFGLPPYH